MRHRCVPRRRAAACVWGAVTGVCLQGCAAPLLAPVPQAPMQDTWQSAPAATAEADQPDSAPWWQRFNDPVLDALMRQALEQNLDIRLAQARILEARAEHAAAAAQQWPQLSASAGDEFSHLPPPLMAPGAASRDLDVEPGAAWTVDLFGLARHRTDAAKAALRASEFERDDVKRGLLAEIATTYVQYRLYQSEHSIASKSAASQSETVRITRVRFEQGAASRLDVERVESELATTRAAVPQAFQLAETARSMLVLLLASTPRALATELPDVIPDTPIMPTGDAVAMLLTPAEVIARRPDVRAAERRLLSAAANLRAALAQRYPQITLGALFGTAGTAVNQLMTGASRTWQYGGGLTLPLFDFGRIRASIDLADSQQLEACLIYERTARSALQETQAAIVSYAQEVLRARELETALRTARNAAHLARRQYQEGALSLLEVLDAERTAYDTELAWAQSAAAVSERLIAVYRTMGV